MLNDDLSAPVEEDELDEFRRKWKQEVEAKFLKEDGPQPQLAKPRLRPMAGDLESASGAASSAAFQVASVVEQSDIKKVAKHREGESPEKDAGMVGNGTSLDFYIKAVEKEKIGNLGEALTNYKKAYKLDPNADDSYRRHWQQHIASRANTASATTPTSKQEDDFERYVHLDEDYERSKSAMSSDPVDELLGPLKGMQFDYEPLDPENPIFVAMLPNELLLNVLKHLILSSVSSVSNFALVCKKFLLLSHEQTLWRHLCEHTYHDPHNLEEAQFAASLFDESEPRRTQPEYLKMYNGDWRKMYIERPRLRFEGVYISVFHYLRAGLSENLWNQPIHLVTYYRYIRFYPDGTLVKYLTTDEPAAVVRHLQPTLKGKQSLFTGTYTVKEGGFLELIMRDANRPRETSFATLQIRSTHRGKQNKLEWVEYSCYNSVRNDRTVYPLKMTKPFYFSVVRSYRY